MAGGLVMNDETAISNLLFDYALAYDERDLDGLRACFIDDATFSWSIVNGPTGGPFEGVDSIVASNAASLASQSDRRRHVMTNVTIRGEGDERMVRTYMSLSAIADRTFTPLTTGVYTDTVVKGDDGKWRFLSRALVCDLPF